MLKKHMAKADSNNPNGELLEELSFLTKRIEFMESQADERSKSQYLDHNLCHRQIQQLQQEVESERQDKVKMLQKKNSEVAYFKTELDSLLREIQET